MSSLPHIIFLDTDTIGKVSNLHLIESLGRLTCYATTPPQETVNRLSGAAIAITNKVVIDKVVMQACKGLKLICIAATGMNNVDLDFADQHGIAVKNVSGYSTESVAQATFAMLLHLNNHSSYFEHYVKSGRYSQSPIFTHHGRVFSELRGKTFGIIGLGNIGSRVAEIAAVFGCQVVYHSASGNNIHSEKYAHVDLRELLSVSDIVSIHCPLNALTNGLIGYEQLSWMKPTAILLNMGRGGIVNESALARGLNEGIIAGAGLDVLEKEPIKENHPLMQLSHPDRLFVTPHIAWASIEARELLIEKIAGNIHNFLIKVL